MTRTRTSERGDQTALDPIQVTVGTPSPPPSLAHQAPLIPAPPNPSLPPVSSLRRRQDLTLPNPLPSRIPCHRASDSGAAADPHPGHSRDTSASRALPSSVCWWWGCSASSIARSASPSTAALGSVSTRPRTAVAGRPSVASSTQRKIRSAPARSPSESRAGRAVRGDRPCFSLQVLRPESRAVRTASQPFDGLPDSASSISCGTSGQLG